MTPLQEMHNKVDKLNIPYAWIYLDKVKDSNAKTFYVTIALLNNFLFLVEELVKNSDDVTKMTKIFHHNFIEC